MIIRNAIASLAVTNLRDAATWYQRLIGRAPDSAPMPEVREWRFDRGGWLQVYQAPGRAGHGSVTLAVDDIEAAVAHARSLGIDVGDRASGAMVKTLMITDPDGNHIAFAETSGEKMAR